MIKRWFIAGIVAVVPTVITVYVIIGLFHFVDKILGAPINKFLYACWGFRFEGLGALLSLFIILVVGALISFAKIKFFNLDRLFLRFPLVKKIYGPIKQIISFLFIDVTRPEFKKIALVEYPRKGIYSLGFVTGKALKAIETRTGKRMYNVFIPSSPSPLTGFTVVVGEEDLLFLDITLEEAMSLIVSGGMSSHSLGKD